MLDIKTMFESRHGALPQGQESRPGRMGVARAPNRRVPVRLQTPLCALRRMQILTRRPKAVSRTRRVAASSSANRSSAQLRIAHPSGRSSSSPLSTRSTTPVRSKSSNLIASTSYRHHAPGAVRDSGSRTSPRYRLISAPSELSDATVSSGFDISSPG